MKDPKSIIDANVKRQAELLTCPDHNRHPEVLVTDKGFQVKACCESFAKVVSGVIPNLLGNEISEFAKDALR